MRRWSLGTERERGSPRQNDVSRGLRDLSPEPSGLRSKTDSEEDSGVIPVSQVTACG